MAGVTAQIRPQIGSRISLRIGKRCFRLAIFFSIGIGLKIGTDIFRKDAMKKLRYNFREGLRFFVFVVLPLLVVAGIIEGLLIGFGV